MRGRLARMAWGIGSVVALGYGLVGPTVRATATCSPCRIGTDVAGHVYVRPEVTSTYGPPSVISGDLAVMLVLSAFVGTAVSVGRTSRIASLGSTLVGLVAAWTLALILVTAPPPKYIPGHTLASASLPPMGPYSYMISDYTVTSFTITAHGYALAAATLLLIGGGSWVAAQWRAKHAPGTCENQAPVHVT